MVAERGLLRPRERIPERTCEQVVDVRMRQVVGQVLEAPEISSQDREVHGTVEQILDVPVSEMVEHAGDRFQRRNQAADCGADP